MTTQSKDRETDAKALRKEADLLVLATSHQSDYVKEKIFLACAFLRQEADRLDEERTAELMKSDTIRGERKKRR